ncbi:hypothetical protein [Nonomuraea typhae]|uniref:hypothetical protein n=1 Tax=Nonomuraea typhae TaxID=2603600 RepID=UPI0012F74CCC|nr:hypothetical protein [Nonomuraea typhae]
MPDTDTLTNAMVDWFKAALDAADKDADSMALLAASLMGDQRLFLQREGDRANRTRWMHRRLIREYENAAYLANLGFDHAADPRHKIRAEALLGALSTIAATYDDYPGYREEWRP